MPIRKIPKNYRNITGIAPHNKAVGAAAYESSLERDFLTLLAFNQDVQRFEVQPLAIEWFDTAGKRHVYTPDVLVHYQCDVIVYEVKYRSDLRENWQQLKPKFQAALRFCKQNGWRFKLITEVEIHTDFLRNARFLLPIPHTNTIRNRIQKIVPQIKMAKRLSCQAAEMKFSLLQGNFPNADYPLAVVQIDHTKLDIILVDDVYRKPIGRPWITLVIDVFSRMVTGFYVSFDPPSALSAGLCLSHSILSKESWLAKHEVKGRWAVWGLPRKIHLDNAKEFRGKVLEKACQQYGIEIEWRPVARPNFGGHIERLLGTILGEIHGVTGTTFSNTRERQDYDSEEKAALTLSEFETWLMVFITDVYHQRVHSALGMSLLPNGNWGF